jgi:rfaE bifunctional protein nucleotidyltransferase chain/domain
MFSHKVLPFHSATKVFDELRAQGKKIVQCHGTFDLIHPGHVYHLEEARELGDLLVVTVTAEKYVNKGPGRPYFNDVMRAKSLAALGCVDYVVLIPYPAAVEAIQCVKPHIYCKGREYENPDNDPTGNMHDDVRTVHACGGQLRYIGSVVFSSSKLINRHFDAIPSAVKEFCHKLGQECSPDQYRDAVESFRSIKVLVIGDIIFDRYSYVKVQGLTSKNRILSARYLNEETQAGGALAVYRHLSQFCDRVDLVGLMGTEPWAAGLLRSYLEERADLCLREESFTTIIKQRFVEPEAEGKELNKLFSVNMINANPPESSVVERVLQKVDSVIQDYDLVVVADFGHGLMMEPVRRLVEARAAFMALNCQTNSNNHGFNIISRQYQRADCFSLDEQELLLSSARRHIDFVQELEGLKCSMKAQYAWLTRGSVETVGLKSDDAPAMLIPVETRIIDTVGAGDAFYSIAALAAKRGLSASLSTFMGQLAGAQAVRIIGNSEPISKQAILKSGMTLLNL